MVRGSHAILTCWKQVPPSLVRAGTELHVISRYGIGLDNIAVDEVTRHGIIVTNVPDYCLDEVSDHAMALLLACVRKVGLFYDRVRSGDWEIAAGKPICRLRGKTLGIIGLGKIARILAPKSLGFGLHLLAFDPYVSADATAACGCLKADLTRCYESQTWSASMSR